MPNHVTNEIIFNCGPDKQKEILNLVCRDNKVDFEVLLPIPRNMWLGSVRPKEEARFGEEYNALDWCRKNWGTKWNAYDVRGLIQNSDGLTFIFDTAWSPPWKWILALFNTLEMSFTHNWFNEGCDRPARTEWIYRAEPENSFQEKYYFEDFEVTNEEMRRLHKIKYGIESFEEE